MKNLNLFHSYVPKSFLKFIYASSCLQDLEVFTSFENFYNDCIARKQDVLFYLSNVIINYITWNQTDSKKFWEFMYHVLYKSFCNLNDEPKKIEKDLQQLINNIYSSYVMQECRFSYKDLEPKEKQKINLYFPKKKYGEPQKLLLEI